MPSGFAERVDVRRCQNLAMEFRVGPQPSERAAAWIARRIRDAVRRRDAAALALSGGSTAPPMIDALVQLDVPWDALTVWQVDERIAPDGDAARNANQLVPLERLPCRVRAMPVTATDRRAAAVRYAAGLPDRFDVVHLGLGDDGHTASWPPGLDRIRDSERAVELVGRFNGWERMTLTRRVVNGARSRVVLTTGSGKRTMVERWSLGDPTIPISGVRRARTWVFVDAAAAPAATLY
jgi:6-phosphogluconolactonase/glucosamine-6-phosphate isomerase/deaminase